MDIDEMGALLDEYDEVTKRWREKRAATHAVLEEMFAPLNHVAAMEAATGARPTVRLSRLRELAADPSRWEFKTSISVAIACSVANGLGFDVVEEE